MISKIFKGNYLKRLDNIPQWLERDTFRRESVTAHQYKAAVFARVLLADIFGDQPKHSLYVLHFCLEVTEGALFHDWDEAILLRDMSHEVKYNNHNGDQIRDALDEFINYQAYQEFGVTQANDSDVHSNADYISPGGSLILEQLQMRPLVKSFVKLADWLSLIYNMNREMKMGNEGFNERYQYVYEHMVTQATKLRDELRDEFGSSADVTALNNIINYKL